MRRPGKVLVCAHFGNSFCAEAAPERAPLGGACHRLLMRFQDPGNHAAQVGHVLVDQPT